MRSVRGLALANGILSVASAWYYYNPPADAATWFVLLASGMLWFLGCSAYVAWLAPSSKPKWKTSALIAAACLPLSIILSWPPISGALVKIAIPEDWSFIGSWAAGVAENTLYFFLLSILTSHREPVSPARVALRGVIVGLAIAVVFFGRVYIVGELADVPRFGG